MATRESPVDESSAPAIVRDLERALAEAYSIEKLDEALKVIAEQARLMIRAHQAALSYIPGGNFKAAVHAIALSDKYEKYRSYDVMPTGAGIWAAIAEQKVSFCITQEELIRHPRWKNFSGLKDARGSEHPPMRGWLAVPILARRGELVGLLQLSDKYEGEFTRHDLAVLTHLAKLVAPTLELQSVNTELQQYTEDLAAERHAALNLAEIAQDARARAEESLRRDRDLLEAIHRAQTHFIIAEDPLSIFSELLQSLLTLTDSKYGFIHEMFYTPDGKPYLTARATTDISQSDASGEMYQQFVSGTHHFSNWQSLYGAVTTSGKPVIANHVPQDPRSTVCLPGHPPLRAFLGLPLLSNSKEFVGVIGLANRPGGYTQEVVTYLEPMVAACANLVAAKKNDQRRRQAEQELRIAHDELELRVQERTKDLRNSEDRFRATFDMAAVGIAHVAPDGKFLRVNQKLSEIVGYSPDELMTRTFQEITYPEDLDADLENVRRVLAGDIKTYAMEKRYYRKDKSLVWVNLTVALVRDDAGQPNYFIAVIEEISRRKSAEEQLGSERKLLTKLLDLQEQERQMVAHDIHDGFVQDVVGAHMHAQSIHGAMDPERMQSSVDLVAVLLQKAIAEGRRLIRDLRPMVLDESGVVEAIVHLIADEQKNEGFTVAFAHDVKFDRLDPRLEGTIFRIVQEALNNVKRHGQIDHAAVQMTQTDGTLHLVIRDHGVGFHPENVSPDRFGLRGICERARLYGGTATIDSVPSEGTTVTVHLPLKSYAVGNVP